MLPDLFYLSATQSLELSEAGLNTVLYSDCNYTWSESSSQLFQYVKTILLYVIPFLFMFIAHFRIMKTLKISMTTTTTMTTAASAMSRSDSTANNNDTHDEPNQETFSAKTALELQQTTIKKAHNGLKFQEETPIIENQAQELQSNTTNSAKTDAIEANGGAKVDTNKIGCVQKQDSIIIGFEEEGINEGDNKKIISTTCNKTTGLDNCTITNNTNNNNIEIVPELALKNKLNLNISKHKEPKTSNSLDINNSECEEERVAQRNAINYSNRRKSWFGVSSSSSSTATATATNNAPNDHDKLHRIGQQKVRSSAKSKRNSLICAPITKTLELNCYSGKRPRTQWHNTKAVSNRLDSRNSFCVAMHNTSQLESRQNAAKMLMAIVIFFGLTHLPVHLMNFLRLVLTSHYYTTYLN